ncbi:MAG: hypothetical protein ABI707_18835 [Ferruginibacter sp.]
MKKLYLFLFTLVTITTVSAQQGRRNDERNPGNYNQTRDMAMNNDRYSPANGYGHVSRGSDRDNRYNEIKRQQEIERLNRDYDNKIRDYRNDRSINQRERERRISQTERERSQKIKSFAGGAVVGALAGILLGALIAGH